MYVAVQSTIICFTQVEEAIMELEVKGSFPVMQLCVGCAPPPTPTPPAPETSWTIAARHFVKLKIVGVGI